MCFRNWLAGWQFLDGFQKQCWLAGLLAHKCVLGNTLAGSKTVVYISRNDPARGNVATHFRLFGAHGSPSNLGG
jgi:hypothetical protein